MSDETLEAAMADAVKITSGLVARVSRALTPSQLADYRRWLVQGGIRSVPGGYRMKPGPVGDDPLINIVHSIGLLNSQMLDWLRGRLPADEEQRLLDVLKEMGAARGSIRQ
jgi:hypothetical protein